MLPTGVRALAVITLMVCGGALAVESLQSVRAQDSAQPPSTAIDRTETIGVIDVGCPGGKDPCWDTPLLVANPGDRVTLVANLVLSGTPHNLRVKGITPEKNSTVAVGAVHFVNFTMPDSGTISFVCDVHPSMSGKIVSSATFASTSVTETSVPELGVHFLSYWVGLIAFMLLFVVYGATFFLFKYNETPETTDHWERAGEGAPDSARRFSPGMASILAILLSAVLIAAVVYLARR